MLREREYDIVGESLVDGEPDGVDDGDLDTLCEVERVVLGSVDGLTVGVKERVTDDVRDDDPVEESVMDDDFD